MSAVSEGTGPLKTLALLYGIQAAFYGVRHRPVLASPGSLITILQALGAPVSTIGDVPDAIRAREQELSRRVVEPVTVAWEGWLDTVPVRLPAQLASGRFTVTLAMEHGDEATWRWHAADSPAFPVERNGAGTRRKTLPVKRTLPFGYHRLHISGQGVDARTMIISAPLKAFQPPVSEKSWGAFAPLYYLHSARSWGAGSFTDLAELVRWTHAQGGAFVGTLPLLAAFLDTPCEFSPYLPASRLLWNEFYIDIARVPELASCPAARLKIESSDFQQRLGTMRRARLVDHCREMALRRSVLEDLARHFFQSDSPRRHAMETLLGEHPEIGHYARFRAAMVKQKDTWKAWPERLQAGDLKAADFDEDVRQYYLYAQFLAQEQLQTVVHQASAAGVGLYLDLPLGTHKDGFDSWRYRNEFVQGVSVGAPPDLIFTGGQNWTFPPLHPEIARENGYRYFIACVRHHLQYARMLRLDHIMGLHRLYLIPEGLDSSRGAYVRYHPEEMYAILAVESHRHQSVIVGEDLGIVPAVVRSAMRRHGLQRLWIMHYELAATRQPVLTTPARSMVAGLNTHDMPPFAAFWSGADIADGLKAGVINPATAAHARAERDLTRKKLAAFMRKKGLLKGRDTVESVLAACLGYMACSEAHYVQVSLADLWLETHGQNIPSTTTEHPNWRRKARSTVESLWQNQRALSILKVLTKLRQSQEP